MHVHKNARTNITMTSANVILSGVRRGLNRQELMDIEEQERVHAITTHIEKRLSEEKK